MTLYGCRTFVVGLGACIYAIDRQTKFIITISLIYGVSLFNMVDGPVA
jgi:hypothetical protein